MPPAKALLLTATLLGCALEAHDTPIGRSMPEWTAEHWINSDPLTLSSLRGRAVLVRWWTGPGCPLCQGSAAALNELHAGYRDRGLTVIGLYHHKSPSAPLDPGTVEQTARALGFEFPVAIDPEWRTLREWWLDGHPRAYTSVTFLLDGDGIVRYIHDGGTLAGESYAALVEAVERVLPSAQPAPATSAFDADIRPILTAGCSPCHFPGGKMHDSMPFDDEATVRASAEGILRRFEDKPEGSTLLSYFAAE